MIFKFKIFVWLLLQIKEFEKKVFSIFLNVMAFILALTRIVSFSQTSNFHLLSSPNVGKHFKLFDIGDHVIEIPIDSYEFYEICKYNDWYLYNVQSITMNFTLETNNNTIKCETMCSELINST